MVDIAAGITEEKVTITERLGLQEGKRDDESTWTRWKVKDDKGRTLSTFDERGKDLKEGVTIQAKIERKEFKPGRFVNNLIEFDFVQFEGNGSAPAPAAYTTQKDDEPDWDKIAVGKTRCALWMHFLGGGLASSVYAKAVADSRDTDRNPLDYVLVAANKIIVAAERDIFERAPGDDGVPFNGQEVH